MRRTREAKPRRLLALSLRTLMALVIVLGGALGWTVYRVRIQREAVEAIEKAGGSVAYNWEWRGGKPLRGSRPPGPKWIVDAFGPDFVGHPAVVWLGNMETLANDDLMTHVGRLTRLEYLSLYNTAVTDAGVARLRRLTRLKELHLHDTRAGAPAVAYLGNMVHLEVLMLPTNALSDADLAHLAGLTKLRGLALEGKRITDKGLVHLTGMRQLERLSLRGTKVTRLDPIRELKGLKHLDLLGSPIDDAGLEPVAGLRSLEDLWMGHTRITDAGLKHLLGLSKLKHLALNRTQVTDAGLAHLCSLPRLTILNLFETEVTDDGLADLADELGRTPCKTLIVSGPNVTMSGVKALRSMLLAVQIIGPDLVLPGAGTSPAR